MGKIIHGHALSSGITRTYSIWKGMRRRCNNSNDTRFSSYGGAGISVCDRWRLYQNFLTDMGECPPRCSIDRFPNGKGNYEPGNCRWASPKQQSQNSSRAKKITFRGETLCIRDWEKSLGLSCGALWHRLKRWPLEKALTMRRQS